MFKHDWFISTCQRCGLIFTMQTEIYKIMDEHNVYYKDAADYILNIKYPCISDDEVVIKKLLE